MGVIIKQSFWGTIIAYLGVIVGYLNALYFRAEYLDLSQIGILGLITANAMIVSPISSFGMGSSYLKYFPTFTQENRNQFFSFLFLITVAGNFLILSLAYLLKDFIAARYVDSAPEYINYLSITAVIVVSNSLFELFFSYSRSILQVVFPSFIRDIYLRVGSLMLIIGFALNWWNFNTVAIGLGIVYVLAFLLLLSQLIIVYHFRFDFSISFLSKEWKDKLLRFGSYSMAMACSFALINNVTYDQVTAQLGSSANGIYTTCFFIALVVEMPRRNMSKVMSPIISSEFARQNLSAVEALMKRGSITMTILGMLLFIGITTNLQDLFDFIPKGSEFAAGIWVVVGVCFAKLILMASSFGGEVINYSHLYKYNLIFQVLAALVLVVLNYYFLSIWGLSGVAFSYLISITFHVAMKITFVWYHFKIHPFMKAHLPLIIIGVVVGIGALLFRPDFHPALNIAVRSILTAVIFIFLIYRFHISNDINSIIRSTFKRFLKINL